MAAIDILQYALTLEHLEAEMYRQAIASGKLSGRALELARTFGAEEQTHADALSDVIRKLGGNPAQRRQSYNFPNFASMDQTAILDFISKIEDTGVGAYLGQVSNIQSGDLLKTAASIYAVEALHTAAIRTLLGRPATPSGPVENPLSMEQVLAAAGPLLGPEMGAAPGGAAAPAGQARMPTQLPRTGGIDPLSVAVVGTGLVAAGKLLHDRTRRRADADDRVDGDDAQA